jgi:hypothetical protein
MGRSGQKSRKTHKKPQHLHKAGEAPGSKSSMHAERQGAMDAMGIGGLSSTTRNIIIAIVVIAFVGGIFGLLILNTFK